VCQQPLAFEDLQFLAGPGAKAGPGTAEMGRYLGTRT
jgi:hypothetical protein